MVRTFLQVYMELSSYFLFLQEQIKDIIIIIPAAQRVCSRSVWSHVVARVSVVEQRDCGTINLKTWNEQSDIRHNSKFKDLGLQCLFAG